MEMVVQKQVVEVFLKITVCRKVSTSHRLLKDGHVFNSTVQQDDGMPLFVEVYQEETERTVPYEDTSASVPSVPDILHKCSQDLRSVLRSLLLHTRRPDDKPQRRDGDMTSAPLVKGQNSDCVVASQPDSSSQNVSYGRKSTFSSSGSAPSCEKIDCENTGNRSLPESPTRYGAADTLEDIKSQKILLPPSEGAFLPIVDDSSSYSSELNVTFVEGGCGTAGNAAVGGTSCDQTTPPFPDDESWSGHGRAATVQQSCSDACDLASKSSSKSTDDAVLVVQAIKEEPLSEGYGLANAMEGEENGGRTLRPMQEDEGLDQALTPCCNCGQPCSASDTDGSERPLCETCLRFQRPVDKEVITSGELMQHAGKFLCPLCGRSYASRCALLKHKRIRHTDTCHVCPVCNKTFADRKYLQLHQRWHDVYSFTTVTTLRCHLCRTVFTSSEALKRHVERGICQKDLHCSICSESFSHDSALRIHMQSHVDVEAGSAQLEGQQDLVCEICGKTFTWLSSLNKHRRKHQGINLHQCGVCGRTFSESFLLNVHMRSHSGERPFLCSVCGKTFTQRAHLLRHTKSHGMQPPLNQQEGDASMLSDSAMASSGDVSWPS